MSLETWRALFSSTKYTYFYSLLVQPGPVRVDVLDSTTHDSFCRRRIGMNVASNCVQDNIVLHGQGHFVNHFTDPVCDPFVGRDFAKAHIGRLQNRAIIVLEATLIGIHLHTLFFPPCLANKHWPFRIRARYQLLQADVLPDEYVAQAQQQSQLFYNPNYYFQLSSPKKGYTELVLWLPQVLWLFGYFFMRHSRTWGAVRK